MYVIADDVKLGLHDDNEERLARRMEAATHERIRLAEEDEHMQVSRGEGGNTVALGSTRVLRQKLGRKLAIKGIKIKEEVSNLGVGFALHKKGKRNLMQTKRWRTTRGRMGRIGRLGGRGGARVAAMSVTPSVAYGAETTGMNDGLLSSLRSFVAHAHGKCRRRSVSARLLIEGTDPGHSVVL